MLSNDDLGNILDIISLHEDWDELSEEIGFDVKELNAIEIEYSSMRRNLAQVEQSIHSNEKIAAEANEKFSEFSKRLKDTEEDWKLRLVKIHGQAKAIMDEYNNMLPVSYTHLTLPTKA